MKREAHRTRLLPLLIEIEQALDRDIGLEALAARFGTSAYHFHRLFSGSLGETPKKHVERLRLEKAALLLAVSDAPVLDIGFAVGFKNPETFSRNFKKFLGYTPSSYRRMANAAQAERVAKVDYHASDAYSLSRARFVPIEPMTLLAVRHIGAYGPLNESFAERNNPWERLRERAARAGIAVIPPALGLFYDDPTMTPPALHRADVCVRVARARSEQNGARCIGFGGGLWAIAEYVGPVGHLLSAFRGLADEIRRSGMFTFRDGPSVLLMHAANVDGRHGVHRLEACFPVQKVMNRAGAARIVKHRSTTRR